MSWQPKHFLALVGILAGAAVLAPVSASASGALSTIVDPVNPRSQARVTANGSLQTDLRDVKSGTFAKVGSDGSIQTAVTGVTKKVASGNICHGAGMLSNIDISPFRDVTVILTNVSAAGADTVLITTGANGNIAILDTLTVTNVDDAHVTYTAIGPVLSVYCSGDAPSTLAVQINGRA